MSRKFFFIVSIICFAAAAGMGQNKYADSLKNLITNASKRTIQKLEPNIS